MVNLVSTGPYLNHWYVKQFDIMALFTGSDCFQKCHFWYRSKISGIDTRYRHKCYISVESDHMQWLWYNRSFHSLGYNDILSLTSQKLSHLFGAGCEISSCWIHILHPWCSIKHGIQRQCFWNCPQNMCAPVHIFTCVICILRITFFPG